MDVPKAHVGSSQGAKTLLPMERLAEVLEIISSGDVLNVEKSQVITYYRTCLTYELNTSGRAR